MVSTAAKRAGKYGVSSKISKREGIFAQVIDPIVEEHVDPENKRKVLGADARDGQGAEENQRNAVWDSPGREKRCQGAFARVTSAGRFKAEILEGVYPDEPADQASCETGGSRLLRKG